MTAVHKMNNIILIIIVKWCKRKRYCIHSVSKSKTQETYIAMINKSFICLTKPLQYISKATSSVNEGTYSDLILFTKIHEDTKVSKGRVSTNVYYLATRVLNRAWHGFKGYVVPDLGIVAITISESLAWK